MNDDPSRRDEGLDRYEHAACGLLTTAAGGGIEEVNRTFANWVGYTAEELKKRRFQDLLTIGCKIFHQTHWMPLLQIQGSVAEVQLELVHRDGQVIPVLVNALERPRAGGMQHEIAVFVATDRRKYERELLIARKQAEQLLERERAAQTSLALTQAQLRLALDSARLLVWNVDLQSKTPIYEPGVRALLGLVEDAELTAESYRACIHADDRATELAAFESALEPEGSQRYAAEYRLRGYDGVERVVSSSGLAFFNNGRLAAFSGVIQDVTSWRLAEQVLRAREQEAKAHAVLAEQLVGIVSHDLRTPLQVVSLGADMLSGSILSPAQARTVHRIGAAASRANRMIVDLLDFTQARLGGGLRVSPREHDVHELVRECVEEMRVAWPARQIEHRRLGDGRIVADPDRVAQVITNLTNNALTYGDAERPVTVSSTRAGDVLHLEVHNQGSPIPEALLPHIFEPLRRGEQTAELGSRSVGLGLYIVRQIASAHGGEVRVRSNRDEGTTFTVTVPVARVDPLHASRSPA